LNQIFKEAAGGIASFFILFVQVKSKKSYAGKVIIDTSILSI